MATTAKLGGADLKSAKIKLRVSRGQVTKSLNELKESGAELDKAKDSSLSAKKLRLAARLMENLEELRSKTKKMQEATENAIEFLLECDESELSKKKEEIVKEYEAETEEYLNKAKESQVELESLIEKAEEIISGSGSEPVFNQARQDTAAAGGVSQPTGGLNDLMNKHSTEKKFKCTVCGKCFRHKTTLSSHLDMHCGIKKFQ